MVVGGAGFALMMSRASPFRQFLGYLESAVGAGDRSDPVRQRRAVAEGFKLVQLLQTSMDRIDPITYAPHLLADTYPGSPAKRRVLMQTGIGDAQVPNLSTHLHARSLGLSYLEPAPRPIYGLTPATAPFDGSAFVEFDFGVTPPDLEAIPVENDNPVHEGVRKQLPALRQIDAFLKPDGMIQQFCDGPCDPT